MYFVLNIYTASLHSYSFLLEYYFEYVRVYVVLKILGGKSLLEVFNTQIFFIVNFLTRKIIWYFTPQLSSKYGCLAGFHKTPP